MRIKEKENKVIIYIHIILQFILAIKVISLIGSGNIIKFEVLMYIVLSIINLVNFYLCISNIKKKLVIRGDIISILSILYIISNMLLSSYFKSWEISNLYNIFLFLLIVYYVDLFTEELLNLKNIYGIIGMYAILLHVFKYLNFCIFIAFFQFGYLMMGLFPIYIIIKSSKKLKKYGTYGYKRLLSMSFFLLIFIEAQFIIPSIDFSGTNIELYLMMVILEFMKLSLESIYLKKTNKSNIKKCFLFEFSALFIFFLFIFIAIRLTLLEALVVSLQVVLFLLMIYILKAYIVLKNKDLNELFTEDFKVQEFINKQEKLHTEKTISFLHDEILQYVIIALRQLKDNDFCENKQEIINILQETIDVTRQEINLYRPKITKTDKLSEVYFNIIHDIQKRYNNDEILIDFTCDESLELIEPYSSVIYKCIHEIAINIFKHSKGYHSEINLKKKDDTILLTIINNGDYMEMDSYLDSKNVGLKILKLEIEKLDGEMNLNVSRRSLLEDKESVVSIFIKIPIKKEAIYESFIDRRS